MQPDHRVAEASARVGRLEAALKVLGENDPDAEPLKAALKQAGIHARVWPVGERLDLCLQYVARVKKQLARAEDQVRTAQEVQRQTEEKLKNGLRDLEVLRLEANVTLREMDVEPREEITRLRAQVAQLQLERQATEDADFVRAKKARTSAAESLLVQGGHGSNASDVMLTLIDAADSTLREAERVVA